VLAVLPAAERPPQAVLDRLAHEYELRDELDASWAARPLALARESGRTALLLEDPGGEPLVRLIDGPMEVERFLGLAIGIAATLGRAHQRGLVHKDIKPANILVDCADGRTRLTGFGIASRLPRGRQTPEPPAERLETIPAVISEIAMKLLAKTAEDRYQTAVGLEGDLRRSLAEWERNGRIEPS
jgi:tRNA A-37 threonylcarbamoyl transferase component Bud32